MHKLKATKKKKELRNIKKYINIEQDIMKRKMHELLKKA